ncbi:hypothetical protein H312_00085 [Anncaliia algerae PRA339]|uniref:DOC domain-containing protein n=1 Tax=Anncaliia algerae PRA339 TaxID=1288291 RepID=A0A059F5N6_9MICR|nr:hypothetical protein H312_00085 [Anncaliia algerae PRA339]
MMEIKLSSFKRDHGLEELFSDDMSEFWHTDDSLPHYIEITFQKLTKVSNVILTLMYSKDDSYTPSIIEIRVGMTRELLEPVCNVSLNEPEGDISFIINQECFFMQIIILSNHQDGKDTHVRRLKILDHKMRDILVIPECLMNK